MKNPNNNYTNENTQNGADQQQNPSSFLTSMSNNLYSHKDILIGAIMPVVFPGPSLGAVAARSVASCAAGYAYMALCNHITGTDNKYSTLNRLEKIYEMEFSNSSITRDDMEKLIGDDLRSAITDVLSNQDRLKQLIAVSKNHSKDSGSLIINNPYTLFMNPHPNVGDISLAVDNAIIDLKPESNEDSAKYEEKKSSANDIIYRFLTNPDHLSSRLNWMLFKFFSEELLRIHSQRATPTPGRSSG